MARSSLFARFSRSLLLKVGAALSLLCLAMLAFIGFSLRGLTREAATEQVMRDLVIVTDAIADSLETLITGYLVQAEALADNSALGDPASSEGQAELTRSLESMAASLEVLSVVIVNYENEEVVRAQLRESKERVENMLHAPPTQADSPVTAYRDDDGLALKIRAPLAFNRGSVWLIADGSRVTELLESLGLKFEAEVTLIDGQGRALVGSVEGFPTSLLESITSDGGRFLSGVQREDQVGLVASFVPIANTAWTVLGRQSAAAALAAAAASRQRLKATLGLMMVFVGLLAGAAFGLRLAWDALARRFHSCFISYSHSDAEFARSLHSALRKRRIRVWLDEHELLPGDRIQEQVEKGISYWDKVLLCCSERSLSQSSWVKYEIDLAFKKEKMAWQARKVRVASLIPVDLDGYLGTWQDDNAKVLRARLAADFTGWADDAGKFRSQLDRLVTALRSDPAAREPPPRARL